MATNDVPADGNALTTLRPPLLDVSETAFRKVVAVLETARHRPEVQQTMAQIRPRLARVRPPRPLTLQRIFYLPIEDLLTRLPSASGSGAVTRRAMACAWRYVEARLEPELARDLAAQVAAQVAAQGTAQGTTQGTTSNKPDLAALNAVGLGLWPAAQAILEWALQQAPHDRALRRDLVGDAPELLAEIQQIRRFMGIAEGIQASKSALPPRPIVRLNPAHMEAARVILVQHHRGDPERAYAYLLALTARMQVPGALLERAHLLLGDFAPESRVEILSRLAIFVLGDMAERATEVARGNLGDLAERALEAGTLVDSLVATERSVRGGSPLLRKELKVIRGAAEAAVGEIVTEARRSIEAAIDTGSRAPLDARVRSEQSLRALRRCARFAERIGLDRDVRTALDHLTQEMKRCAQKVFDARAEGAPETEAQNRDLIWAARMLELAGDPELAENIWRKAQGGTERSPPA